MRGRTHEDVSETNQIIDNSLIINLVITKKIKKRVQKKRLSLW